MGWRVGIGFGGRTSYASAVAADTPLAWWRMEETSGTTAADSSGNGHTGTYVSATLAQTPALCEGGYSARFVNNNNSGQRASYVSTTWNPSFTAFSVEAWVLVDPNVAYNSRFVANAYTDTTHGGFQLYLDNSPATWRFAVGTGTSEVNVNWAPGAESNAWRHLVGTYDGTTVKLYRDNVLRASGSLSGTIPAVRAIMLGADPDTRNLGDGMFGNLDEVAIYGYALSAAQISAHYTAATNCTAVGWSVG